MFFCVSDASELNGYLQPLEQTASPVKYSGMRLGLAAAGLHNDVVVRDSGNEYVSPMAS
jgi:hypothetical protein